MSDTSGLVIVTAWLESMPGKTRPQMSDCMRLAADIDAAIEQAWREGAEAMREATADKCLEVRSLAPRPGSYGDGWTDAADTIENAVTALPPPGDAS